MEMSCLFIFIQKYPNAAMQAFMHNSGKAMKEQNAQI